MDDVQGVPPGALALSGDGRVVHGAMSDGVIMLSGGNIVWQKTPSLWPFALSIGGDGTIYAVHPKGLAAHR